MTKGSWKGQTEYNNLKIHSQELRGQAASQPEDSVKRCKHNKRRASAVWHTKTGRQRLLPHAPPLLHLLGQLPAEAHQPPSHRSLGLGLGLTLLEGDLEADAWALRVRYFFCWRAGGDGALIPIAVLLQSVEDVLRVWVY